MDLDKAKVEVSDPEMVDCILLQANRISSVVRSLCVFRQTEVTFYTSPTFSQDSQLSSEPVWVWTLEFLFEVWLSVMQYSGNLIRDGLSFECGMKHCKAA